MPFSLYIYIFNFKFYLNGKMREDVYVLVLGDVGRSPRMQYHASSLASLPHTRVRLIGFTGERCVATVERSAAITQHLLAPSFAGWPRSLFLLYAPLKVLWQLIQLLYLMLWALPPPRAVLVQNPPSIPALLVVWLVCALRGGRMVVDWHNFGYTVLGHGLGAGHPLVCASRAYERCLARRAHAHLCVTNAMRLWLDANWGVRARVLYDRPPAAFQPATLQQRHDLFARLGPLLPARGAPGGGAADASGGGGGGGARSRSSSSSAAKGKRGGGAGGAGAAPAGHSSSGGGGGGGGSGGGTLVTDAAAGAGGAPLPRAGRPAVIVSSTSWTPDEDFFLLLDALQRLDAVISAPAAAAAFPDVLMLVTGKGPGKAAFEAAAAAAPLRRVAIRTLWLEPGDYPLLLGSADVGVSLHASTSGLDLPMKVVDMFGAGLPVAALGFSCLPELVRHDDNGLIFRTAGELCEQLESLLDGFPDAQPSKGRLTRLRRGVERGLENRWVDNWNKCALPLFA